ncbi:TraB/GumN family protein [Salinarchaeum chitinilyticum]
MKEAAGEDAAGGPGQVTVVGTAHVSEESADRVRSEIEEHDPDVVAVELDEARYRQMMEDEAPDDLEPADLLSGNTVFQFLAYWMLSYVQNRLGDRFDIEPGADMRAGVETAEEHGRGLALVDRDIQETVQRFWARLTIREKLGLVGGLAVGAADGTMIGLSMGVALGVLFGIVGGLAIAPMVGLGGAFALGLGGTVVAGVVGGVVVGALVGLVVGVGIVPPISVPGLGYLGAIERAGLGLLGGVVAGGVLAVSGASLPFVGAPDFASMGGTVLRGLVGALTGGAIGGAVGMALGATFGPSGDAGEELDEFDIESLTDADVVTAMMEEFRQFSPGGAEALIDERDAYIAHQLVGLREEGYDVVAIVGAGHREGIESYLAAPETLPTIESITGTQDTGRFSWGKAFGYLMLVGFVAFFGLLALGGAQNVFLLKLFAAWFLFNGAFAFTAARLAGARLDSAAVGGGVAWLTSINPLLAPGWFAGYVELRHRPVNVADIGTLNELLDDHERPIGEVLGDMLDVPLFRLIAVVAMTNVGSFVASILFPFVVLPFFFEGVGGIGEVGDLMLEGVENGAELLIELVT